MKLLICAISFLVAVHAAPNYLVRYAAPVSAVVGPSQSQYHAQDELGQYSFGHQEPNQARSETKDAYGVVRGSYSYTEPSGKVITNNYIADENGFRSSLASSNGPLLPVVGRLPVTSVELPATSYVAPLAYKSLTYPSIYRHLPYTLI